MLLWRNDGETFGGLKANRSLFIYIYLFLALLYSHIVAVSILHNNQQIDDVIRRASLWSILYLTEGATIYAGISINRM